MACPQAVDSVQQTGQDRAPGGLKMEIAAPAVLIRQHIAVAGRHGIPRGRDRQLEERRSQYVAGFTPIESRVRDDDLDPAYQQGKEAQRGDPVSNADDRGVPRLSRRGGQGPNGSICRVGHTEMISRASAQPVEILLYEIAADVGDIGVDESLGDWAGRVAVAYLGAVESAHGTDA